MAWSLVQHAVQSLVSGTSGSKAYTTNPTSGNLLLAMLAVNATGETLNTPTDTIGNTWVPLMAESSSANSGQTSRIWAAFNTSTAANTVSVTWGVAATGTLTVVEFSGIANFVSQDGVTSIADGIAGTGLNYAPGLTGDLLIYYISAGTTVSQIVGGGWTQEDVAMAGTGNAWAFQSGTLSAVTGTADETSADSGFIFGIKAVGQTLTPVGQVHLATYTPSSATAHSIKLRAKKASGVGTITVNAALYEGTTNRSGDLASSAITTSLADYTLAISDAAAATIVDRSNLSIKFWGRSTTGDTIVVSLAEVDLIVPVGSATQVALAGRSLSGSQSTAVPFVEVPSLQGVSLTGARSTATLTLILGGSAVLAPGAVARSAAAALLSAAAQLSPAAAARAAANAPITTPGPTLFTPVAGSLSAANAPVSRPQPFSATAGSLSQIATNVVIGTPPAPSPYVFDAIVILDGASVQVAEIARSLGPLESGFINADGTWTPAADPVALIVDGFGIDPSGNAYYDTEGADFGDRADLFVDPVEDLLFLQR